MSNLRKYTRAPITQYSEAEVESESEAVPITLYDISLGGMGFTSFADIQVGDTIKVYFKVLDKMFSDEVAITNVRKAGHSNFYGCEFTDLAKDSCDAIKRYVFAQGLGRVQA